MSRTTNPAKTPMVEAMIHLNVELLDMMMEMMLLEVETCSPSELGLTPTECPNNTKPRGLLPLFAKLGRASNFWLVPLVCDSTSL